MARVQGSNNGPRKAADHISAPRLSSGSFLTSTHTDKDIGIFTMSSFGGGFDDSSFMPGGGGDDYWAQEFSVGHQPLSAVRSNAHFDDLRHLENYDPPSHELPQRSLPYYSGPFQATPASSSSTMYNYGAHTVTAHSYSQGGGMTFQSGEMSSYNASALESTCDDEACPSSTCGAACGTACEDPDCGEPFNDVHHGPPCDDEACNPDTRCTDDECYPAHANCPPADGDFWPPPNNHLDFPAAVDAHNNNHHDHTCIQPCLLHYHHAGMSITPQYHQEWVPASTTPSSAFTALPTPVSEPQHLDANELQSPLPMEELSADVYPSIEKESVGGPLKCCWVIDPQAGTICGDVLDNTGELFQHCNTVHVPEAQSKAPDGKKITGEWTCYWDDCGRCRNGVRKAFKTKSKLERHLQSHAGHKPWKCEECGLELSAKQALDQHMRIHTGEQPFKCSVENCDKSFKQQSALTMHMRTHTGQKPLKCEECGKVFSESSNLAKHRHSHHAPRHECAHCEMSFHRRDQLRKHAMRIHKKELALEELKQEPRDSRPGSMSSNHSSSVARSMPPPMPLSPTFQYGNGFPGNLGEV